MVALLHVMGFMVIWLAFVLGNAPSSSKVNAYLGHSLRIRSDCLRRWIPLDYAKVNTPSFPIPSALTCGASFQHFSGGNFAAAGRRFRTSERSINKITLLGRVGGDPETRFLPSGDRAVNFSVATSEHWKDKATGDPRTKTEWHRVCVYDQNLCDVIEKFVRKGRRLYLEGTLQNRRWTTVDGQERQMTEVILPPYRGELVLLENPEDQRLSRVYGDESAEKQGNPGNYQNFDETDENGGNLMNSSS